MLSEIIAGFPNITKLRLKCVAVVPLLLLRRAPPTLALLLAWPS